MTHASVWFPFVATDCCVPWFYIYPSSLADKSLCPKWKRERTEVQRSTFLKVFKGDP